ncbi:MAG: methylamine dehydrogenase light chain [Geminicoccaceae bacterium]
MSLLDDLVQKGVRQLASRTSRRGVLGRLGRVMAGAAVVYPVLPVDRVAKFMSAAEAATGDDPLSCEYWRYCGFDGFLCSCCGGNTHQCPAGTSVSTTSWVGTCMNPTDNKAYLIQYTDCCGHTACGRCMCNTNVGERPAYLMGVHNDINWCMANTGAQSYHCTLAAVVGVKGAG